MVRGGTCRFLPLWLAIPAALGAADVQVALKQGRISPARATVALRSLDSPGNDYSTNAEAFPGVWRIPSVPPGKYRLTVCSETSWLVKDILVDDANKDPIALPLSKYN